jgi:hypothetical protein
MDDDIREPDNVALSAMAQHHPSPIDVREATTPLLRWTRLSVGDKPHAYFCYKGIHNDADIGFLVWLVASFGVRAYENLKATHTDEAAHFRKQILMHCSVRANWVSHLRDANPGHSWRARSRGARAFPSRIFGGDPVT